MGQPKLLMPFCGRTVLDCVLEAWTNSRVDEVVVVVRADDQPLQDACRKWPVEVVCPTVDPHDMKSSLCVGMDWIRERRSPCSGDGCFVGPCDLPEISASTVNQLVQSREAMTEGMAHDSVKATGYERNKTHSRSLVVPSYGGRAGHPILFSWSDTKAIFELGQEEGLNRLLTEMPTVAVEMPAWERPRDIDTPEEYRAAVNRAAQRRHRESS